MRKVNCETQILYQEIQSELSEEKIKLKKTNSIIRNVDFIVDELDREFCRKVQISGKDIPFIFLGTALQCVRQFGFTSFVERSDHREAELNAKKSKKFLENWGKKENIKNEMSKKYYAPLFDIMLKTSVPYDIVFDTQKEAGLCGKNHRRRTLGHDPVLGYIFGTANIATNTLTYFSKSSEIIAERGILHTKHVDMAQNSLGRWTMAMTEQADTIQMFDAVYKRFKNEPIAIAASIVKQYAHIKSDIISKEGIPLPFVGGLPNFSDYLAKKGIDTANVCTIGKQYGMAHLINYIIFVLYTLYSQHYQKDLSLDMHKVKGNRVITISNIIAEAIVNSYAVLKKDYKKLDIGGMLELLHRIAMDINYRKQIEKQFIEQELYKQLEE